MNETCPFEMFTCKKSNRCISPKLLCDGNTDCENNEDEENCVSWCNILQFQCPGSSKCIPKYQVCDGKHDCGNREDERNCQINSPLCSNEMFLCEGSGQCISRRLVCNELVDCLHGEDEKNCSTPETHMSNLGSPGLPPLRPSELGCPSDEFYCPKLNRSQCIYKRFVCDGKDDCGNREDENNCDNKCSVGQFFCKQQKKCIPEEYVCDGESDCMNDEDETGCTQGMDSGAHSREFPHKLIIYEVKMLPSLFFTNKTITQIMFVISGCPSYENGENHTIPLGQLVPGGSEFSNNGGTTLYVCRAYYNGNNIPGKYHPERKSCHFSWEGREYSQISSFQLLRWKSTGNLTLTWVKQVVGIPKGVVEGGRHVLGDKLHMARCRVKGDGDEYAWIPGRYDTRLGAAFTGFNAEELGCNDTYEFLTCGIRERLVIDGTNKNCGNGSCTDGLCGRGRIACSDGSKCISHSQLCDRKNDCGNKYDERLCTRKASSCPYEMFTCKQSRLCISPKLLCDGNNDCKNNEDEENCGSLCSQVEFQCPKSSKCISKYQLCDGKDNCGNKEDETNCETNSTSCSHEMFHCKGSSQCISRRLVCNGISDCENGADEKHNYCFSTALAHESTLGSPGLPPLSRVSNRTGERFLCPGSKQTLCYEKVFCQEKDNHIPAESVCDGEEDCPGGEDEIGCPPRQNLFSNWST